MRTDGKEYRFEALAKDRLDILLMLNVAVELDIDTVVEDILNIAFDDLRRQPVFGNADPHHAAENAVLFKNRYAVAHQPQFQRR